MPKSPNSLNRMLPTLLLTLLPAMITHADDFAARIGFGELTETAQGYVVDAQIDYRLSPTAKEALHKGVPLAWDVYIVVKEQGILFDTALFERKLRFYLRFNALLNQYEVKNSTGQLQMFLSLNAALNFMANLHDAVIFGKTHLDKGKRYLLAVKTEFDREYLPVPLRPVAYLDSQWFLSSDWFVWPIQK